MRGEQGAEEDAEPDVAEQGGEGDARVDPRAVQAWCEHCVRGRGEGVRHEAGEETPEQTEVHMDVFFVGDEDQNEKLTVLAARERTTRMTVSTVAPSKGERQFLARRVQAFLKEIGADTGDITLKSDQEPAMKAVLSEVSRHRAAAGGVRSVIEHSAVEDSKGNGVVERAAKSIKGQIRVARSALDWREDRAGACGDDMVDRVRFIVAQQV